MNKIKKLQAKLLAHKAGMVFMSVLVLVGVVSLAAAFSSNKAPQNVIENVGSLVIEAPVEQLPPVSDVEDLGSVTSPFLPGPEFAVGDDMQFSVSADLIDASTTIFSIATPFRKATSSASDVVLEMLGVGDGLTGATTTVELVRINVSGAATSTYQFGCGASANGSVTSTLGVAILTSDDVGANFTGVIENGLATAAGAAIGGGSVAKIQIGPSAPYLVCRVHAATPSVFTSATNTFAGKATVRFSRTRQ